MKKRTSRVSRRIVSLLMSMVLTLTLVTPAAFATEVVDGSSTTIVEGDTNPADANLNEDSENKGDEDKGTEDGGDEQPTNPGDEDKKPDEGDGEDANKPDEDKKDEENPDGEKKDEENKDEQPTEEPSEEIDTQEGEGIGPVAVEPSIAWYTDAIAANGNTTKFTINSAADLLGLAQLVNGEAKETAEDGTTKDIKATNFSGCEIVLANDIDLSNVCHPADESGATEVSWMPIGDASHAFAGTFDGNGCSIKNLYINNAAQYQGLFGNVGAGGMVKNLIVTGTVTADKQMYVGGIVAGGQGTVWNCGFYGVVSAKTGRYDWTGGIAGSGTVKNCWYFRTTSGENVAALGVGGTPTNCYHNVIGNSKGTYIADNFAATVANKLNIEAFKDTTLLLWKAGADGYPVFDAAAGTIWCR